MPSRSERRKRLKKRRRILYASMVGCFLLTGFIPAQTAQAPVGQHVLKELAGDISTYKPPSVSTSNHQQKNAVHPSNQTGAATKATKGAASSSADHSSQSNSLPVVAMKPEDKPSVTEPTYDRSNQSNHDTNGTSYTNERKQPAYQTNPVTEPSSSYQPLHQPSNQPSRKPTQGHPSQPTQNKQNNPPDSASPPPQQDPPSSSPNNPPENGGNGIGGLLGGILNPVLDTVNKTLP